MGEIVLVLVILMFLGTMGYVVKGAIDNAKDDDSAKLKTKQPPSKDGGLR